MAHVSKRVPGELTKENLKKEKTMKKGTIGNIIFAIIGAFLFGLGCDIHIYTFIFVGLMIILISLILAIAISDSDT